MKILATGPAPEWVEHQLNSAGHEFVSVPADLYIDEAKFVENIKEYDVYISGGLETCTSNVINAATKLKAIVFLGVDPKNYIDLDAAKKNNVPVFTTPGANARAVAELAIFLTLSAARKTAKMLENIQNHIWKNETGFELENKTLGLIGSGPIAQNVAKIANGFDMNVIYWTRSGEKENMNGQYSELDHVLKHSDIISLHVPKDAGEILNEDTFKTLKDNAILINTSPASLVNMDALHYAITSNKVSCSAFDCFYTEGQDAFTSKAAKLLDLGTDRFFISPHAGWRTKEADDNMFKIALENIEKIAA